MCEGFDGHQLQARRFQTNFNTLALGWLSIDCPLWGSLVAGAGLAAIACLAIGSAATLAMIYDLSELSACETNRHAH